MLALACVAGPLTFSGCSADGGYHHHHGPGYGGDDYGGGTSELECRGGVGEASIDTGQYLELEPGVGITAEYFGDGAWRFATQCDTEISGAICHFQLTVAPVDGTIDSFAGESIEPDDLLDWDRGATSARSVVLDAFTDVDVDAFTLQATPGSTLELTSSLDGYCATHFLYFWSDGDTPDVGTTSVELTPSSP